MMEDLEDKGFGTLSPTEDLKMKLDQLEVENSLSSLDEMPKVAKLKAFIKVI